MSINTLYSNTLDEINKLLLSKNYDYCSSGVTRFQSFLEWKKIFICNEGKLYAGVRIQDKSFSITVEPYIDFDDWKEKYSFKDKNNSSQIYINVAEWENKILEELSMQFGFLIKGDVRQMPYKYNDFKFMKYNMKEDISLSELAQAVDGALQLITKESVALINLGFDFVKL